jgi:hypothetical protein
MFWKVIRLFADSARLMLESGRLPACSIRHDFLFGSAEIDASGGVKMSFFRMAVAVLLTAVSAMAAHRYEFNVAVEPDRNMIAGTLKLT